MDTQIRRPSYSLWYIQDKDTDYKSATIYGTSRIKIPYTKNKLQYVLVDRTDRCKMATAHLMWVAWMKLEIWDCMVKLE